MAECYEPIFRQPERSAEIMQERDQIIAEARHGLRCWQCGNRLRRRRLGTVARCRSCRRNPECLGVEEHFVMTSLKGGESFEYLSKLVDLVVDMSDICSLKTPSEHANFCS